MSTILQNFDESIISGFVKSSGINQMKHQRLNRISEINFLIKKMFI